jgi:hypothetical protein
MEDSMDTELTAVERKVVVYWDDDGGLRCEPDEIRIKSRRGDRVLWTLVTSKRDARIVDIVFTDKTDPMGAVPSNPKGPFGELQAQSDPRQWIGTAPAGPPEKRYKYSVWVSDESGERVELDPLLTVTERP